MTRLTYLKANIETSWRRALPPSTNTAPLWRKRDLFREIIAAYSETPRKYHGLDHIHWCLLKYNSAASVIADNGEVAIALIYHDVVYNPDRKDNEERSAAFAQRHLELLGAEPSFIKRVCQCIMATRHTGKPIDNRYAKYTVDIDLSSLAAKAEVFRHNSAKIQIEYTIYGGVSESDFDIGRAGFLTKMLSRDRIFYTDKFYRQLEKRARVNLRRGLRELRQ